MHLRPCDQVVGMSTKMPLFESIDDAVEQLTRAAPPSDDAEVQKYVEETVDELFQDLKAEFGLDPDAVSDPGAKRCAEVLNDEEQSKKLLRAIVNALETRVPQDS